MNKKEFSSRLNNLSLRLNVYNGYYEYRNICSKLNSLSFNLNQYDNEFDNFAKVAVGNTLSEDYDPIKDITESLTGVKLVLNTLPINTQFEFETKEWAYKEVDSIIENLPEKIDGELKPVVEPVVPPVVEETPEPVVEPQSEETPEPVVEPQSEETHEPVVEPQSEETHEPVVEPQSEETIEKDDIDEVLETAEEVKPKTKKTKK